MKKVAALIISTLGIIGSTSAQAFSKDSKYISLQLAGSQYWNFVGHSNSNSYYWGGTYAPVTGEVLVQAEFPVHKYVGVGFVAGIGGGANNYWYGWGNDYKSGWLQIPIGAVANFHFYQLIADKTSKDIHADKLDIYAGVSLGTGVGVLFLPDFGSGKSSSAAGMVFGGPHAGIRYYFKPNIAVNGELGWGKSFAAAGLTFKL